MPLWSRLRNTLHAGRASRDAAEELQAHLDEATAQGRDPLEARRSLGSTLRYVEQSRDARVIAWLDSLRADLVFGWRQLTKHPATSAAAILSLALAIGACTAAFRIIDALLLRPLPIAAPGRLYSVAFESYGADGKLATYDSCSYPMFRRMRAAIAPEGESVAISYAEQIDLTYGSDRDMEKANRQFVSGWMFSAFGVRTAAGRLLIANDGAVVVLSYDYWNRRFGRDPHVVGRTFRMDDRLYEVAGVAAAEFTGTETGIVTDMFLPITMRDPGLLASYDNFWLRTLVHLKPGIDPQPVREQLRAVFHAIQEQRAQGVPQRDRERMFAEKLLFVHSPSGRSNLQRDYGRSLAALAVMVALLLLIACANVANLMTVRAAARAREMALRVSIGAGRARMVQLVLLESVWIAFLATAIGAAFAWWSAPAIVRTINPADNPVRLMLPADARVFAFTLALALAVTLLFGVIPALRASAIQPASALKGGDDPHTRRRLMHGLIAVQIAFCFIVIFVAGLFVSTFDRLSNQPIGFWPQRIVNLEVLTHGPQPGIYWEQVAAHLRRVAGVDAAALAGWPLMSGESWGRNVSFGGAPADPVFADFYRTSPGWIAELRIPLLDGRDFGEDDVNPGTAIVNRAFAKQYFNGENPIGRSFDAMDGPNARTTYRIVGWIGDARIRDSLRRPVRPTVYIPFSESTARGTFVVRTAAANPLAMASILRREVPRARGEFLVSNVRSQTGIIESDTARERLLARLALFFSTVALLLAAIGLYGVLDFSVLQRRREIGIRLAIGATGLNIARLVTIEILIMTGLGALAGIALGEASSRYIQALLFEVQPSDARMLALPSITILTVAMLAALPAILHALRIDPAVILREQ